MWGNEGVILFREVSYNVFKRGLDIEIPMYCEKSSIKLKSSVHTPCNINYMPSRPFTRLV